MEAGKEAGKEAATVVIGAGGFIGGRIMRQLAGSRAIPVSSSASAFDEYGRLVVGSLPAQVPIDAVIYLSQSPRYREVPEAADHLWSVNVVSAIRAAEWARRQGARRFIYASSGTVYAPQFEPNRETDAVRRDQWYALSKVHAEEALQRFVPDLAVTCLRLFGVYGPGQQGKLIPNLIASIGSGRTIQLQRHPQDVDDRDGLRLSLIHVDDAAAAIVALLSQAGPDLINVASPEVLSIRRIAAIIGEQLGRSPVFEIIASAREGDVIADVSRLRQLVTRQFAKFEATIGAVIATSEAAR